MKLVIKPRKGLGRIEIDMSPEVWSRVRELSERYGVPPERIIEMALTGDFREPKGDLKELERRVKELEERVWELEREYAPLKFKAYGLSEDNKLLAIELLGLLSENSQLRRFSGMKPKPNRELRRLISYYLQA
ncbi:MAG: hypothetical protein GXO14_05015 [Thermococci archaeon]|nr:hypothetical protein [Thermococci archaeon]